MKSIFARIWAVWGIISFIATFLVIFLPSMLSYLIKDPVKSQRYFIIISRIWMNVWLRLIACPVKINGRENFAPGENYVVVFNHNALLDVPLSAPYVPGPNKTIAKKSFAKVPLFGLFYSKGSVLVDRKSEKSRIKSYDAMKKVLRLGIHMCIYPEGTRNRTDQPLKQFYDGAFKLSVDAQKKVLPCVIIGTGKAMPIHKKFYLMPTRLKMNFLAPISPEGLEAKALKEKVYKVMLEVFVREK